MNELTVYTFFINHFIQSKSSQVGFGLSPKLVGSSSSLQIVNHLQDISLVLVELWIVKLDLFKLLDLSIQIVINWSQWVVKDLKMISFKFFGNSQDISEVSWLVFKKPFSVALMVPSIGQVVFIGNTKSIILILEAVVNVFKLFLCCFQPIASQSVVFGSVTWIFFGLLFEKFFFFLKCQVLDGESFGDCWPLLTDSHFMSLQLVKSSLVPLKKFLFGKLRCCERWELTSQGDQSVLFILTDFGNQAQNVVEHSFV